VVGVGPRHVNTARSKILLSRDKAFRREFVIAEGAEKLTHQNIALHICDVDVSHIARDQFNTILQFFVQDHVAEGDDCVWVLIKRDDFDICASLFSCSESSTNEWASSRSKIQHGDQLVFIG